ncbi:DUF5671 domain-containing protein [Ornithinimicrobium cerasi]|uniref:DUF5671 domain-containing protein n=1 Tax=Ornithinimicrobium cerasi TaxID=2248773 RepID=A0A285VEB0_9MICO|nr:DUF5671 domain-containing protein [Ornithinimicrobium cerasi]SOC51426.1 hypothetical protein SAMN05421879_101190 [Ornithinimicrobium cerasi]
MILSLISSLLTLGVVVGAVVLVVVLVRRRGSGPGQAPVQAPGSGAGVRRFFQYLLLVGLLLAAASGVTGLLGRLLDTGRTLATDDATLALQLALALVALPLWGLLAWWTARRAAADPSELRSAGWTAYLTIVGLVSLVTAMVGWYQTLTIAVGAQPFRSGAVALAVVWTLVWAGHRWWGRPTPQEQLRPLVLLGALAGLLTAAAGLADLVARTTEELTGLGGDPIVGGGADPLLRAAALAAVGTAVWAVYWLRDASRGPRGTAWLTLVLLVGVGGGLLAAISALSVLGYDVLVWLVGEPRAATAAEHFADAPDELGTVVVGLLVWWYHRAVLDAGRRVPGGRTEVRRVYEYVMAAVGLLAASSGLVMILVTLVEAIAARGDLVVGGSALNALLAALVLLAVGIPVWLWHWRLAQGARRSDPAPELRSVTRRTYLLVLFGVAFVAAVVALITLAYLVLEDALAGSLDTETMRRIRFALGILVTTSLLSAYHWTVFRSDRQDLAAIEPGTGTGAAPQPVRRTVVVVGELDAAGRAELAARAGAIVQVWRSDAGPGVPPTVDQLAAAVEGAPEGDVLVLAVDGQPRALTVHPPDRR